MPKTYNFVLTGRVAAGHARAAAASALAKIMRVPEQRALELLAGKETVVKRNLDAAGLASYQGAFGATGVEVRADEIPEAPVAAPVAPAQFQAKASPAPVAASAQAVVAETVTCPACGTVQAKRNLCTQCGGDMRRLSAAKAEAARAPAAEAMSTTAVRIESESFTPHPLNVFSLGGRVGRVRYLAYAFPAYLPFIGAMIVGGISKSAGLLIALMIVGGLATMWLGVRLAILRLHDLNLSGLWVLLPLAPMLAIFTGSPVLMIGSAGFMLLGMLAMCVWPGSMMSNDYGPPPGPNTVWTIVGAVLFILLSLIGGFSGGAPKAGS